MSQISADLEFPFRMDSRWVEAGCPAEAWSPSAFLGWRSFPPALQPMAKYRLPPLGLSPSKEES